MSFLDEKENLGGLSTVEHNRRKECILELERLAHLEIFWRQISLVFWLKEGDNKTKFFHKMSNSNRCRNYMERVEVDGIVHDNIVDIRDNVVLLYENLYQEGEVWRPSVDGLDFKSIGVDDSFHLERRFEREVFQDLKDLKGDKASRPDGFTLAFFSKSVGRYLGMMLWVFLRSSMAIVNLRNLSNATFISLIPKKRDGLNIRDFDPINLVGNMYKLLAKVLANRVKGGSGIYDL